MKISSRFFPLCAAPFLAAVSMLCAVQPASADFLYELSIPNSFTYGFTADIQFTQPAIVTSPTTVTSFLVNRFSPFGSVDSVFLNPVGDYTSPCPCIDLNYAGSETLDISGFLTLSLTSVGTFVTEDEGAILTISPFAAPAPEPSSLGLFVFVIILGGAGFVFQKRLRGRRITAPPISAS